MKNFLKKLHLGSNQSEDFEGSTSLRGIKTGHVSSPDRSHSRSHQNNENKPFAALSGWLNSVTSKNISSPPSSSNSQRGVKLEQSDSASSSEPLDAVLETVRGDSGSNNSRDADIEEECQIQLALELSAREDPEAVQIEAVKQISLGSCPPKNTPAEVVAYRYWNYNALSYDDKILDGFYDVYGILTESMSSMMPSLIDLQGAPVSDIITWEAVLVNRAGDANLLKLEQKALEVAVISRAESLNVVRDDMVRKIAALVSDFMGGPVTDPDKMSRVWKSLSISLRSKFKNMVLPLGSLTIGLARHRALLFKVLADSVGIPCRLVKGWQFTGSHDAAMNFVKIDDGREYIVDLMADPGTLIPADVAGPYRNVEEYFIPTISPFPEQVETSHVASSSTEVTDSLKEHSELAITPMVGVKGAKNLDMSRNVSNSKKEMTDISSRANYPNMHARSPSWTEGVSSPAAHKMKVKDVSQYMIDAAKENPQLAQKLHDVLLESGVVAPPNLFTEVYSEQLDNGLVQNRAGNKNREINQKNKVRDDLSRVRCLPPLSQKYVENRVDERETSGQAAAMAVAAVVASSMVVAAKNKVGNVSLEIPVVAATAAAVVATTAVVNNVEIRNYEPRGNRDADGDSQGANTEGERTSDKSVGNDSTKSDISSLDDVADCEIQWEEITLGERIGLGSYGEVYRGDWHGTEVAVKKFLDQDITVEFLEEFRSEVRIMKRIRHPNVVLFMGAITRAPNLSIVTEFLPRGSLYRLLHRPNNQLDERRRLRMALDAARGMNYLHNCTPVIVHRDLKSPNLLVDKNWVVKVCDFGLSRLKHSTFLSSRSTAGTAEWMAPEVLRNEPSNEKCDVYSFGVILWELVTMQQPWNGLNPMQVVGAVGFQHRRLDIPDNMDPAIADIISKCWQTDPTLRPSFKEIMAALKPLQKTVNSAQNQRQISSGQKSRPLNPLGQNSQ